METKTEMDRLKAEVVSLSQEVHRLRGLVKRKNDVLREVAMLVNVGRIAPPLDGGHYWDDDGERCVKCGEKDWIASPTCKPVEQTYLTASSGAPE